MRREALLVTGVGCLLILLGCYLFALEQGRQWQMDAADRLQKGLLDLATQANPLQMGARLTHELFRMVRGRGPRSPDLPRDLDAWLARLPRGALQVILVDRDQRPVLSRAQDPDAWPIIQDRLGADWLAAYGLPLPTWRTSRSYRKGQYALMWQMSRRAGRGEVAGVAALVDVRKLPPAVVLQLEVQRLASRGWQVGLWDRLRNRGFRLPHGVTASTLPALLERTFRSRQTSFPHPAGRLVLYPWQGTLALLGLVPRPAPVLPGWTALALAAWLTLAWTYRDLGQAPLSLPRFLALALGVAAGLPLLLTALFCVRFDEGRTDRFVGEELKALEQQVITIDQRFSSVRREREARLPRIAASLTAHLDHLERVLPELAVTEIRNRDFDSLFLVSSQAVSLRGFSFLAPAYRMIIALPLSERRSLLKGILDSGVLPMPMDFPPLFTTLPRPDHIERFWASKAEDERTRQTRDGVALLGKMMVQRDNQARGVTVPGDGAGKADLVYGAVIDPQTGDLLQVALGNLGRIIDVESGPQISWFYVDVLRDRAGVGQYFVFAYLDLRSLQHWFLHALFQRRDRWPANWSLACEGIHSSISFPFEERRHELRRYLDLVRPPRVLSSRVIRLDGKPTLMTAFAGRQMKDYVLFATRPWSVIRALQRNLRLQIGVIGSMMVLLLLAVLWRLHQGVVAPAQALLGGIQAMEHKRYDHRIAIQTGDEWERLGASFNGALEGMAELEVAGVVQAMILPASAVRGAGAWFLGKSAMTGTVGGDYFDAVAHEDGSLSFVIGDVTGHGVSAALVVAMAKSCFHILMRQGVRSPAEVLACMNRLLLGQLGKAKALTMMVGLAAPDGQVTIGNAGHPYPFRVGAAGQVEAVKVQGVPLGILAKARFGEQVLGCREGERLFFYTDGIIEQRDPARQTYGLSGLQRDLAGQAGLPPEPAIAALQGILRRFTAGAPWDDDVTMAWLVIERQGGKASPAA